MRPLGTAVLSRVLLTVGLLAAVAAIGWPNIDAPWIQGDEHSFIASNADVTGEGRSEPTIVRWLLIFCHRHLDLYQPIPILTYAVESAVWGERRIAAMRIADVAIHALNALLVWRVFAVLLERLAAAERRRSGLLGWALALLWAVHPTLTGAFAADMGRTHLLSATFLLLSLLAHLAWLDRRRPAIFARCLLWLVLAMMCKPVVGWFLVVAAIEAAVLGPAAVLRSARVLAIAAVGALFALVTLSATQAENMLRDSEPALFGGPIPRAAVAVVYYVAHILWPVGLATWYPPDVDTGWTYWATWVGLALFVGTVAAALVAWRRPPAGPLISIGLVWFWAALLPLLGLIGARVAAAQDRYLYVPLMGLLVAIGAAAELALRTATPAPTPTAVDGEDSGPERVAASRSALLIAVVVALAAVCVVPAHRLCRDARSTLARAERVVARDPVDPRRILLLAVAIEFAQRNGDPTPAPNAASDPLAFPIRLAEAAYRAENQPSGRSYFKDGRDRAMFHFRVAEQLFGMGDFDGCYDQARRAAEFDPDAPLVLMQLAHACQVLGRFNEELEVYRRLESRLPANRDFRAKRLTEFGMLLLDVFEQPAAAMSRFQQALESDPRRLEARLGLARCEILVGQGAVGRDEVQRILAESPENLEAQAVLALYYARSQQWDDAYGAYRTVLHRDPTHYDALRGFHGVCAELNRVQEAAAAWREAARLDPANPVYYSFYVFAAACAGDPSAADLATRWLEEQADNRFACLAHAILAVRSGRFEPAIEWVRRATRGPAYHRARELQRCESALRVMQQHENLGPEVVLVRAAILRELGAGDQAAAMAAEFLRNHPDSRLRPVAESMLSAATSAPLDRR